MMGHSPPIGEEKKILASVSAGAIKLCELLESIHLDYGSAGIEIDHAREGVRTNGRERTTTVLDVMEKTDEIFHHYQKQLRDAQKIERKVISIIDAIREDMKQLPICPHCEGKKGYGRNGIPKKWEAGSGIGMAIKQWEDCGVCGGRGVIS